VSEIQIRVSHNVQMMKRSTNQAMGGCLHRRLSHIAWSLAFGVSRWPRWGILHDAV
jgi:hypothetical protein